MRGHRLGQGGWVGVGKNHKEICVARNGVGQVKLGGNFSRQPAIHHIIHDPHNLERVIGKMELVPQTRDADHAAQRRAGRKITMHKTLIHDSPLARRSHVGITKKASLHQRNAKHSHVIAAHFTDQDRPRIHLRPARNFHGRFHAGKKGMHSRA